MLQIRAAQSEDVGTILKLIRGLAEYEHEPHAVEATEQDLLRDGFGDHPRFHCALAEWNGEPVGFALYFYNYSTWKGRHGIFLDDLFVYPEHRGKASARRCCCMSPASPPPNTAAATSGWCSTGTLRPSNSTKAWAASG